MKLAKRTVRTQDQQMLRRYPALRGFHKPQREHVKQPMPIRPQQIARVFAVPFGLVAS